MKSSIKINNVEIDLTKARVDIQDHNEGNNPDNPFSASNCEVVVWIGTSGFVYQTSATLDVGGVSSQLAINRDSGAYDSLLDMLTEMNALTDDEDEDDQVYAAGKVIGDALGVQKVYDDYLAEFGVWERADGMDANTETFRGQQ